MHVSNLKYPEWHTIACNKDMTVDTLCDYKKSRKNNNRKSLIRSTNCVPNTLPAAHNFSGCLILSTKKGNALSAERFQKHKSSYLPIFQILSKVNQNGMTFGFHAQSVNLILYQYNILLDKLDRAVVTEGDIQNRKEIFFTHTAIKKWKHFKQTAKLQFTLCNGEYLTKTVMHNRVKDCANGTDEAGLQCWTNGSLTSSSVCKQECLSPSCLCSDLYFQSIHGGCFPYSQKSQPMQVVVSYASSEASKDMMLNISQEIDTSDAKNISSEFNREVYSDCTKAEQQAMQHFAAICTNDGEIQCTSGCRKCFPAGKLCVFEQDNNDHLMHCSSGSHLKNCSLVWCNNMFKCPKSYCTPYK